MADPGNHPRGNSSPRGRLPTFTTRAIGMMMHCVRQTPWVRKLDNAAEWLRHGENAERDILNRVPGWDRRLLPWLRFSPFRAVFLGVIEFRIPGTVQHLLCRKIWFHEQGVACLETGEASQVVILGAGLDPLGLRLCRQFEHASVIEVDRPAPMDIKREAFADVLNLRFVDVEAESIEAGPIGDLASLGCDPDLPTLVIAEGLLMYLDPSDVARTFERFAASSRAPLRFAFSYLSVARLADPTSPIARLARALERRRPPEHFAWSTTPEALPGFLTAKNYTLKETISSSALAARILDGRARPRDYGEFVAIAATNV